MKILFIAHAGNIHTQRVLEWFTNRNHEVYLISHQKPNFENKQLKVHVIPKFPFKPLRFIHTYSWLKKEIKKINPEIIDNHFLNYLSFLLVSTKFKPLILSAWGSDIFLIMKKEFLRRQFMKYTLKRGSWLVTLGERSTEACRLLGANIKKSSIFYLGVDTKKFNPKLKKKSKDNIIRIITNRRLEPIYNHETLIKSIPLVLKKIKNVKFIFSAGGVSENKLKSLAKSLNIDKKYIEFTGMLPYEKVRENLLKSDVFVSIPHSDSTSVALTEAMSCGLPIIVRDKGFNKSLIKNGENAFIIPNDKKILADKIITLVKDKKLREKFGKINRDIAVKYYDYDKEMKKREVLYDSLINKKIIKKDFSIMKILFIAHAGSIHTRRILEWFTNNKHEVHLISHQQPNFENKKLNVHVIPKYPFKPLRFIHTYLWLKNKIKEIGPDIIDNHYLNYLSFLLILTKFKPLILTAWGSDILLGGKYLIRRTILNLTIRKATWVNACSEKLQEVCLSLGAREKNSSVILHGVDTEIFKPKEKNKKQITLITTRRLEPIYNHETLIRSIPLVLKRTKNVKFIFSAGGFLENKLKSLAKSLNIDKKYIEFTGMVSYKKIKDNLLNSDIFVSIPFSDGTSPALMEAMSCGLPIIVTDTGFNKNWIKDGENAFIVPKNNLKIIADKIINLSKNKDLRQKFGKINRKIIIENAEFNKEMKKIEVLYYSLIN
tara:strand:- start:22900 stop:25047 length:2148 start_codon:yes stop_codon:yes gene_type:complete